ncbi:MFS transporter [Serratia marcescens]|uniref:MFS transporter n=1 Tax=Serratia marcescens TaxID=615 RepID=UPI000CCF645B|nr:MFS transporter [Serratia marcescens]PNU30738.1 MFS transporter [Serratia marcescens]POP22319.1 MFS transporter [Serratia marcescens]POP26975.1 MFS transporter [Serratia marcescens]WLS90048.1 MFS transporter [Serratia marcescens]
MRLMPPIFFIALGLFGVYCIEFGVVGILPQIIARYGISTAQAGWLVGIFALTIALLGPLLVLLASRFNRKRMLLIALTVFAAASALSAQTDSFAMLMLLRIVPALFHPIYFSLAMVAAAALYPPHQATKATAYAFIGTSMGMVLGIPLTQWIAGQFSYEASFRFCAWVNLLAAAGLLMRLPDVAVQRLSYGKQLMILRSGTLWLNIITCVLIFAAMFAVYAYAAEYLSSEAGIGAAAIGFLLVAFGVGGVAGNLLAGKGLSRHRALTVLLHPLALIAAYALLYHYGSANIGSMTALCLYWGAAHTSGLIVTQIWLTSEAPEAPAFATGLYIAFINLGVAVGSLTGGWFIAAWGLQGSLLCGALFAALAVITIAARLRLQRQATAALRRSSPSPAGTSRFPHRPVR